MQTFNDTTYTIIHKFTSPSGQLTYLSVIEPIVGTLYGVTSDFYTPVTSSNLYGSIYSCNLTGGNFTTLYNFSGASVGDGAVPYSDLIKGSDGNLYGTTRYGGYNVNANNQPYSGFGTIFKFDLTTNQVNILYKFSGTSYLDGYQPGVAPLVQVNNILYGTTFNGGLGLGDGLGVLFSCSTSGNYGVIHRFLPNNTEGTQPTKILYFNNYLYGICYYSGNLPGSIGGGTLYKSDLNGNVTVLHKFSGQTYSDGQYPTSIVLGSDGNLYGTTQLGGTNNQGTIFKYNSTNGNYNIIYNFSGTTDGRWPQSELTEYNNTGIFYGVTPLNGLYSKGTIFSCNTLGNFGVIHQVGSDPNDSTLSRGKILLASNGSLYGTQIEAIYTWIDNSYCEFSAITSGTCVNFSISGVTTINPICSNDGQITIYTSGGTYPITYNLSDGFNYYIYTANTNSYTWTGLQQGSYYLNATDALGASITYLSPIVLTNQFFTNVSTLNNENICITITGGTSPYTITLDGNPLTWDYGNSTNCYSATCGTNHIVNISDDGGCSGTTTINFSCATPTISFSGVGNPTCTTNGYVGIDIIGGDPNYTISGSNITSGQQIYLTNQTTPIYLSGLGQGTWNFIVNDSNGDYSNILTTTLTNTFFVDLYQTSNTSTGATYCFIVTGSSANFVEVNVDSLFFTAYTNTVNCFTMPSNACDFSHYFSVTEYLASGTECTYNEFFTYDCPDLGVSVSVTNPYCNCTGVITATATGGTGSYTYTLTDVSGNTIGRGDSGIFNTICSGEYTVTVVDSFGNTVTYTPILVTNTFNVNTYVDGFTSTGVTFCFNVSGGSGTYNLTIDSTSYSIGNGTYCFDLGAGYCYDLEVLDTLAGCIYTATTCTPSEALGCVNYSYTNPTCSNGLLGNGTVSVEISGGSAPYVFSLYSGGTSFASSTPVYGLSYNFNNIPQGTFQISVTDNNLTTVNCYTVTLVDNFQVNVTTSASCVSVGNFLVNVTGGTTPYTIQVGASGLIYTANTGGLYTYSANCGTTLITINDSASCSKSSYINIPCGIQFSASTFGGLCGGNSGDGYIIINAYRGNPPYQYSINNGVTFSSQPTFTGLTAGTYSIVVTDISGCTGTSLTTLSAGTQVSATTTSVSGLSCTGLNILNVTLNGSGGIPPYTYQWGAPINSTSQTVNVASYYSTVGTYTVSGTVTDQFGCFKTIPITFTTTSASTPTLSIYNSGTLYCDGSQYVTLSGVVVGNYSQINWSNGQSGVFAISATTPGTYYYTVSYSGCVYTSSTVTVAYPTSFPPIIGTSAVLCPCQSTTLEVIPNGTTYTDFVWSNGQSGSSITVSSCTEGSFDYYVTAKDQYGCSLVSNTVNVTYTYLDTNIFKTDSSCCTCADGYAEVQLVSGVGPFTFYWTGTTSTSNVANNLLPGTYSVTVVDSTGCFATYTFEIFCEPVTDCIYEPVRSVPLPEQTEGDIILNPDGTISFYNPTNLPLKILVDTISEDCCVKYSTPELPLQYCNGKCYWEQPGCEDELPQKIILGALQENGVSLSNETSDTNCQNQVSFDFMFNFDCESLFNCVLTKYDGNILTFLSGLSVSATIEVLTGSTYVTRQTVPIWKFNINNAPTGVYFNGTNPTYCEYIDEIIKNDLGVSCTGITENTFAPIWQHASFKIYDSLNTSTIKLGLLLNGFNCDYNILLDNLKIEQVCVINNEQILSDNSCPGFDIEKIVDNKKSWLDNTEFYDRNWQHLKYRDTLYYDIDQRLDINTKEVDIDIDVARAIEYDAYCYAVANPCFLSTDCNNLELSPKTASTQCFVNQIAHPGIEFFVNTLSGGTTYTFTFDVRAAGFGTSTNLLIGVSPTSGTTSRVPLLDSIVVSTNGNNHYSYSITLPTTYPSYNYVYFDSTTWINPNPLNPKTYCLSGSTLSVKEYCDPTDINLSDFISVSSETSFEQFRNLVQTQLIDVKNRQPISDYPLLRYMFDKYLDICGLNNCQDKSAEYNYDSLNSFIEMIGDYWINLMEQFVPATTIWKGGTRTYRNSMFDQPKFEYRNFSMGYCDDEYCFEGNVTNEPTYSAACYVSLTPVQFSGYASSLTTKLNGGIIKSLITNCAISNDLTCCTLSPLDCFISANVGFKFTEGSTTVSNGLYTTNSSILLNSTNCLNLFYSGLTQLGYNNSYPYNNFVWSRETTNGCNDKINVSPIITITYSCLTATSVTVTATTGDITYQKRLINFPSTKAYPIGNFVISGNTLYGVTSDFAQSSVGTIFSHNITTYGSYNTLKTFNIAIDGVRTPASGLVLASDGYLYGTALVNNGSNPSYGGLYRINPLNPTTTFATLKKFTIPDGGGCWIGQELILDNANNLIYIPLLDVTSQKCAIYKWNTSTQTGGILHNFSTYLGEYFIIKDGTNIYGTSKLGGLYNSGGIFSVNLSTGQYTQLYSFNALSPLPNNIINPSGKLAKDTGIANTYYGLTNGPAAGYMSIYRFNSSTLNVDTIFTFTPPVHTPNQGLNPKGNLVFHDNKLFGVLTTNALGYGSLFRYDLINPTPVLNLHQFGGSGINDAAYSINSYGNLQYNSSDNFFYGTSPLGGSSTENNGTVYRFTFTGGTSSGTTLVYSPAIYNCTIQGESTGLSPLVWDKTLVTYSSSTYVDGTNCEGINCLSYCATYLENSCVEVIVEDYTNISKDPCAPIPVLNQCNIIYATHIDNDVWFEGSVTVTKPINPNNILDDVSSVIIENQP